MESLSEQVERLAIANPEEVRKLRARVRRYLYSGKPPLKLRKSLLSLGFTETDPDTGPQLVRPISETRFFVLQGNGSYDDEETTFRFHDIDLALYSERERERIASLGYDSLSDLRLSCEGSDAEVCWLLAELMAEADGELP